MTRKRMVDAAGRFARNPQSAIRNPKSKGVTLIELLIAITILAILAGLILGVGAVAAETARVAQTKSTIARIHTLLMDHYDSYRNRRVSLSTGAKDAIDNAPSSRLRGELIAEARLHAIREVMLMELPDRWSDLLLNPVPTLPTAASTPPTTAEINAARAAMEAARAEPLYASERSGLAPVFASRLVQLAGSTNANTGVLNTREQIIANQSAECLFMIVMLATGDGEAPGLFSEKVIGDTDGDGAREFLDGWGNPIQFLRWAPGADSPTQLNPGALVLVARDHDASATGAISDEQAIAQAVINDRDPFDLFRVERYTEADAALLTDANTANDADGAFGYKLLPLVYSLGGDEESGILDAQELPDLVVWDAPTTVAPPANTPGTPAANPRFRFTALPDPYLKLTAGVGADRQLGATIDSGTATDNITNHLITAN